MGIIDIITKRCTQVCVYWGTPIEDGQGGKTYADPVEIDCRWEEKKELFSNAEGEQIVSKAVVIVLQDVSYNGMLFLGDLDDLDSSQEDDPSIIEAAYTIKGFMKMPTLGSTTQFLRKVFLT